MRGGSVQTLKEILGHADLKMALRYSHLAPAHLQAEMAKAERMASPATPTEPAFSSKSARSVVESPLASGKFA
jgi:hypothetical protein